MSGLDLSPERAFFLVADPNVIYQFYFFERDEYTHQHAPWREDRDKDAADGERGAALLMRQNAPGDLQRHYGAAPLSMPLPCRDRAAQSTG